MNEGCHGIKAMIHSQPFTVGDQGMSLSFNARTCAFIAELISRYDSDKERTPGLFCIVVFGAKLDLKDRFDRF